MRNRSTDLCRFERLVIALHRDSGEIIWNCSDLKSGPHPLLLDGDRLHRLDQWRHLIVWIPRRGGAVEQYLQGLWSRHHPIWFQCAG